MAIALAALSATAAFAVLDPGSGTSTPNGDFVFVPNQIGTAAIRVVKTADDSVVQTMNVISGTPASMVTSPSGDTLFVVVTGATNSRVRAYSIDPTTGALTSVAYKTLSASYTAGRQCALTPDGKYLYVANFDNDATVGMSVYVLDVSNPSSMTVAGSFQVANYLWGIAMKPDGTRLYVGSRDSAGYKVYIYNITNKTSPSLVTSIDLGTAKDPTTLAVNSDGDRLFVKVFETSSPRDDVLMYDISATSPVLKAEVNKINGNNYRSDLPGDHSTNDSDTRNSFDGMALSPNGWFMYFTHYNGASADGGDYWRDTLYGTSIANLSDGFTRTSASDIWVSWGGYNGSTWGGWHSADGLIATKNHKIYYTYDDDSLSPSFLSVLTTTDANTPPTAPKITYPTQETNVNGYITWEASEDDGGADMLTYTVEYIQASVLEAGTSSWLHMAYTASGEIFAPLSGVLAGTAYYARVQAYDGTYTSPWSYTGPFTMDANFLGPPTWESYYLVTSKEAVIDWGSVATADHYVVEYKTASTTTWSSTEILSTYQYNTSDPNPNYQLTGLTPSSTYEVRVKAKKSGTESLPSSQVTFYTLERPWADFYKEAATQAYITWGPEVSTAEIAVPLSNHYEMQYRRNGGAWTDSGKTLNNSSHDDATNAKLNILFNGLTANSTYEVRIRTVDVTGGVSDWSDIKTFHTIRGPWWVDVTVTSTHDATIFWENVSATQYELRYGQDPTVEAGYTTVTTTDVQSAVTGLTAYTWYYTKVRALTVNGPTDWTSIKSFYTMPGPTWISNYLTTISTTMVTWEGFSGITSYEVNYGVSMEPMSWTSWAPSPQTQNYGGPITGLTARTWYQLRVRSHIGANASSWSSIDDFFTIPAPNNVTWNGSTLTTSDITWEPVNMGGPLCTSYEVSWGISTDATGTGDAVTGNIYSTISGLTTGRTYYVKVRARDDANSGWSDWAPYPTLTVVATDQATVSDVDVTSGWRGTTVKITGQNFGATTGTVSFGATAAQPGYWENNEIAVSVPPNIATGAYNVIVKTAAGITATHVPSQYSFNVTDGGFVMDDFEGGVWEYATWESGGGNSVKALINYTSPPERNAYITAECSGTAAYEIVGGVSTYGDLPTENGYDISSCKKIKLWFKGDGSSNVATFELVESNQAPGNNPAIPLAAEVWKYNVPISMSSTSWQQITIDLTTEGASKFVLDSGWYTGNSILDLNKIKSYQILTGGGNKKYAIDYIFATTEAGGAGTRIYDIRYIDETNSENWIAIPFAATGITDSIQLAQSIAQPPIMTPQAGDRLVVTLRDNKTQNISQGWSYYDGSTWMDEYGSPVTINPGDAISVVISNPGRPQIDSTWTVSGNLLSVGGGGKQYDIRYIDETNSENWIVSLDNLTGITDSIQLAQSIAQPPIMTPQAGDRLVVTLRDNKTQNISQGWSYYDGSTWMDEYGSPVTISKDDFVSVVISNPGRPQVDNKWP